MAVGNIAKAAVPEGRRGMWSVEMGTFRSLAQRPARALMHWGRMRTRPSVLMHLPRQRRPTSPIFNPLEGPGHRFPPIERRQICSEP
jgi:hypothetical protein